MESIFITVLIVRNIQIIICKIVHLDVFLTHIRDIILLQIVFHIYKIFFAYTI